MNNTVKKKLFFSMTLDFLETYIPQDSPSLKTVKHIGTDLAFSGGMSRTKKGYP